MELGLLKYKNDGTLDMRCRHNKEWLRLKNIEEKKNLKTKLRDMNEKTETLKYQLKRHEKTIRKLGGAVEEDDDDMTCSICTDVMVGEVILRCGHKMCPSCFAQHSRVNNKCPFCRKEFAVKPKKIEIMPDEVADQIVDSWSSCVSTYDIESTGEGYFKRQSNIHAAKTENGEGENHMRWVIGENAKILIKLHVKNWYTNGEVP